MINVTKPYMPERSKLDKYIDRIYDTAWLTNNGPLVKELTERLKEYLGVKHLLLVSNGTLALQITYRALGVKGKAITTPFSFVATASSLVWEGIEPVFADIDPQSFCLDPCEIKKTVAPDTQVIVPVHVFGGACDVEAIGTIATETGLKTIYDASHAFGVKYKGKGILEFGDAATLSFHATKLYHTIEGGAIAFKNEENYEKAKLLINFGIDGPDSIVGVGINAKMNEFQAAMGLAVLDDIDLIMEKRAEVWNYYEEKLKDNFQLQKRIPGCTNNYAYFPIMFENEDSLLKAKEILNSNGINPRRYFYPSLDTVEYIKGANMGNSRDISRRILCLPMYAELETKDINTVSKIILSDSKRI